MLRRHILRGETTARDRTDPPPPRSPSFRPAGPSPARRAGLSAAWEGPHYHSCELSQLPRHEVRPWVRHRSYKKLRLRAYIHSTINSCSK